MAFWHTMEYWLNKRAERDLMDKSWGITLYTRQILKLTNQMFRWKNLPDTIPEHIMELWLQTKGTLAFTKVNEDYYVFFGNPGGTPDVYYNPTQFIVANPGLNYNASLEIGEDCVWMKNDSQYMGILPIIERYAKQMVENDISILDAQFNMRIQSLITADNDNARKSGELYLERVKEGKPGIILAKGLSDGINTKPFATAGTSNGLSQLIELHQYLKAQLLSEFGLNANFNMKRERINTAESELNQDALLPMIDDMLHMRKLACDEINAMYGLSIDVEKNSTWEQKDLMEETRMEEAPSETPVDEAPEETTVDEAPEETPVEEAPLEEKVDEVLDKVEEVLEEVKKEGEEDAE